MKALTLLAIASTIATTSPFAFAEVSKKDQDFITQASGGGIYEIQAGKLAQTKGQSEAVRSLGGMLVKDHSAANDELKALAAQKGAVVLNNAPADKQKKLDKLATSKNFDKDFLSEVGVQDHQADIVLFEKTRKDADDADIQAFAAKTLPILKAHQQHAEVLNKSMH